MTQITVCLCTFRRPQLVETLKSLANQVLPKEISMDIVLVNNEAKNTALESEIEKVSKELGVRITYAVEPQQNIALARNRTLLMATGDWVAFIDDDEIADPHWLKELYDTAQEENATAVMGPVLPAYPQNTPVWIEKTDLFYKPLPPRGRLLHAGRTSSALVDNTFLQKHKLQFDAAYGLTGGSDHLFFQDLLKNGGTIVSCPEAIVHEEIEEDRLNMAYLKRRALRGGEGYERIHHPAPSTLFRCGYSLAVLAKAGVFWVKACAVAPLGKHKWVPAYLRGVSQVGKLRQLWHVKNIEIYKV